LKATCVWPHAAFSQRATWPPSAAVRQRSIALHSPWLGGDCLTLADLYVAPMLYYFLMVPEGQEMFSEKPNLAEWLRHMGSRESMQITRPTT
jgi:glutathione S-transferase